MVFIKKGTLFRFSLFLLCLSLLLAGCIADGIISQPEKREILAMAEPAGDCPVSKPTWEKPKEDAAIQNSPEYGWYFVNEDRSIWASAWWEDAEEYRLRVQEGGTKVGWFRPAGVTLEIGGERIDGQAPPLEANIPCCYPTRFQATGIHFPTPGCWEVKAKAAESELSFVVWVAP